MYWGSSEPRVGKIFSVGGFVRRFGRFVGHNGIISVTINVVVNTTFGTVISTLIGGVVSPFVNLVLGGSFSSLTVAINRTGVRCNTFVVTILGFLVVTIILFTVVGLVGAICTLNGGGRRRTGRRRTPAAGMYPFYGSRVTVSTAHYPRYASRLWRLVSVRTF